MSTGHELERLYREDGSRIWWAVLAFTGDREVASDAVSEAFAQALGRGSAIRSPLPWIWRTAFRVAAGEMKRRSMSYPLADEPTYELGDDLSSVVVAMRELSPKQRAAIVLHYYADYSLREIAEILGIARPTVGVHLHRGRRKLREVLEEDDG